MTVRHEERVEGERERMRRTKKNWKLALKQIDEKKEKNKIEFKYKQTKQTSVIINTKQNTQKT